MDKYTELLQEVKEMQVLLISVATGKKGDNGRYTYIRNRLQQSPVAKYMPECITLCHSLQQFSEYIKMKFDTYEKRRESVRIDLQPLIGSLQDQALPIKTLQTDIIKDFNSDTIHTEWKKALERGYSDPEGAITSARSLLESTLKHILDDSKTKYDKDMDLPKLYKEVAKLMNLAPEQQDEDIFKQILGGCSSVVCGLGAMRNRLSDSHGKSPRHVKPSKRHAELSVNISGAMTIFLCQTYIEKYKQ